MENLSRLLKESESWLIRRIVGYAKKGNYTKYTSTLEEAWRLSIAAITGAISSAFESSRKIPEIGVDEDLSADPLVQFGVYEAKKHRERGITIEMFLGLLKYYRQSYVDLVETSDMGEDDKDFARLYIERSFDRVEIGFCSEWANRSGEELIGELQAQNRKLTNAKNMYLTVFESIADPALLVNRNLEISNVNYHFAALFDIASIPGALYYATESDPPPEAIKSEYLAAKKYKEFQKRSLSEFMPRLAETLREFVPSPQKERTTDMELERGGEKRLYKVSLSKMLDISEKFEGCLIIMRDVTEVRNALAELNRKVEAESFMGAIMAKIGALNVINIDPALNEILRDISDFMGIDGARIMLFSDDMKTVHSTHHWRSQRLGPLKVDFFNMPVERIKWWMEHAAPTKKGVIISDVALLPEEAASSRKLMEDTGVKSLLISPMNFSGNLKGVLVLFCADKYEWLEDHILFAANLSEILISALELHKAKNLLHESLNKYRTLFENASDAIFIHGLDGKFVEANKAACERLGYAYHELMGMTPAHIDAPEYAALVPERLKELFAKKKLLFESVHVSKSGERIPVEINARIIEHMGAPAVLSVSRDLRERKTMQTALRNKHNQLISMLDSASEIIYVADPNDYEILFANLAFRRAFGEREGHKCYKAIHGFDEPCSFCTNPQLFKDGGKHEIDWELYIKRLDKWFRCVDRVIAWPDGRLVRYEMATDITDKKRAEEDKEKLSEQLRQSQKMDALGRLAGGVAHDFNNILTVVTANASLAMMGIDEQDKLYKNLNDILRASGRASDLVRQLLAFSRNQVIEPKILSLNDIVESFQKMLKRIIGEDIIFKFEPEPELWSIKADPGQMEQIIVNLSVNSRYAMPGGGSLSIKTANVFLNEEFTMTHYDIKPGDYVMLSVKDTGTGMDEKVAAKIFEPFFTTKPEGEGTGLGLSTVYGIVQQHGGCIDVFSKLGEGTEFKIYLPRIQQKSQQLVESAGKEKWARGSETVLFAEDDESLRKIIEKTLTHLGYKILAAKNGKEAIELSRGYADKIHIIVTDVVMPEINGKAMVDIIVKERPDVKILFISGYAKNTAFDEIFEKGYKFLPKPYSPGVLVKKIRELLDSA